MNFLLAVPEGNYLWMIVENFLFDINEHFVEI
jgi:hypothetical protein